MGRASRQERRRRRAHRSKCLQPAGSANPTSEPGSPETESKCPRLCPISDRTLPGGCPRRARGRVLALYDATVRAHVSGRFHAPQRTRRRSGNPRRAEFRLRSRGQHRIRDASLSTTKVQLTWVQVSCTLVLCTLVLSCTLIFL